MTGSLSNKTQDVLVACKFQFSRVLVFVAGADMSPFAPDFVEILSEIVGNVAPVAGPFLAGLKQLLEKMDEVKDRKGKAAALVDQVQNILTSAIGMAGVLQHTDMAPHVEKYTRDAKEVLKELLEISILSRTNIFFHLRQTKEKLSGCEAKMQGLYNALNLKFGEVHTVALERVEKKGEDTHQAVVKVLRNMDSLPIAGVFILIKMMQPLLTHLAEKNKKIAREIDSFGFEKLRTMQTDAHVDPKVIKEFQECIQNIARPDDIMIIPLGDLRMANDGSDILCSHGRRQRDSVVRQGVMRYDDPETRGISEIEVVVKSPESPISQQDAEDLKRRFTREMCILYRLKHRNIVRFFGIIDEKDEKTGAVQFGLVSQLQKNSDLRTYVSKHHAVNRFKLLHDASMGLKYLNTQGVYHGHIKCSNIFVDETGTAAIGDFTKASIDGPTPYLPQLWFDMSSPSEPPTEDWKAPERYEREGHESVPPTAASDIYSFGMAILECLTLKDPFACTVSTQGDLERLLFPRSSQTVLSKRRPNKPKDEESIDDSFWEFLMRCWAEEPEDRPTIDEVMRVLHDKSQEFGTK